MSAVDEHEPERRTVSNQVRNEMEALQEIALHLSHLRREIDDLYTGMKFLLCLVLLMLFLIGLEIQFRP